MRALELDDYIVYLAGRVRQEPISEQQPLMRAMYEATHREYIASLGRIAYALKSAGKSSEDIALMFDMEVGSVNRHIRQHADRNRLPRLVRSGPKVGDRVVELPRP